MRSSWRWLVGMGLIAVVARGVAADDLPTVDLSTLDDVAARPQAIRSVWDAAAVVPVSWDRAGRSRFYLTGLLGESFATLADPTYADVSGGGWVNRSVITGGGAMGVAFDRGEGQLRIEAEGRGRDDVTSRITESLPPVLDAGFLWAAADGWSAMVNVWRDFTVSEQVDCYLGGGIGGGGYRYSLAGDIDVLGSSLDYASNAQVAGFAWQLGGGLVWNLSERLAFDLGYRFFSLEQADATLVGTLNGTPLGSVLVAQQFTASELLFGLRVYEPFRRWR